MTFGSDPEFFIEKNGKIFSAIGILKGTKEKRVKVGRGAYYYDNVLAECTIHPAKTLDEAVANVRECFVNFKTLLGSYKIKTQASHVFDPKLFNHEDAYKIGCDPEECVYELAQVAPDEEEFKKNNMRSAGGHIHLGDEVLQSNYSGLHAARLLDLFLGIPSLFMDHDPTSSARKKFYGKAGRIRRPVYGIEYRSLGNFWLASPKLVRVTYKICDFVVGLVRDDRAKEFWEIDDARLQSREAWADPKFHPMQCHTCKYDVNTLRKAFDTGNKELAAPFMELIKGYLPAELFSEIESLSRPVEFDLYKEWSLN